jgi:hypothetical protein
MTHETPGDPLARGLPSPVCTDRAGRQSRRQETVTDRGKRPVQERYAATFGVTILHSLLRVFPTLTCDDCCPSAARASRPSGQELRPDLRQRRSRRQPYPGPARQRGPRSRHSQGRGRWRGHRRPDHHPASSATSIAGTGSSRRAHRATGRALAAYHHTRASRLLAPTRPDVRRVIHNRPCDAAVWSMLRRAVLAGWGNGRTDKRGGD